MEVRTTDQPRMSAMEEFEALPEGTRAELIDGEIVMMGSPSVDHQRVAGALYIDIGYYLRGKCCRAYYELDVQLDLKNESVFRPDITVVCDPSKITQKRIVGTPDLIIEVLSPSTAGHDSITKLNRYIDAGVRECWIVSPEDRIIHAFRAVEGYPAFVRYRPDDHIPVAVLEGCEIDLSLVFPAPATQSPEE